MLIVGRLFLGVGIGLANQVSDIYHTCQVNDGQYTHFCIYESRLAAGKCSQSWSSLTDAHGFVKLQKVTLHLPLNGCHIEHLLQCCRWHPCTSLRPPTRPAVAD